MKRMGNPAIDLNEHFTYRHYRTWPDEERWELIDGRAWDDESDDDVDCVVQPDVVVYCDRSKLTRAGARGAPDLALEVLSPSTSKKDQREKFDLYERTGVREYWVADPIGKWLCVYRRDAEGRFDGGELRDPDREYGPIGSVVLEGLVIDPRRLFEED
jgi:Uma2 family endonuclease